MLPRRLAVAPVKEILPLPARQHQARRLASGQEAGATGHFPDLAKYPLGGVDDREIDVGRRC
jgi:hypothetical protein